MITKFNKFNLIKESPDCINDVDVDTDLNYFDEDAIPFFASVDKNHTKILRVNVGDYEKYHSDITYRGQNKAYAGRLWEDYRIMSFWVYPNVELFKQLITKLEKKLKIKIFNNDWKIEVIINDSGDIDKVEYDSELKEDDEDYFFRPDDQMDGELKIIPIEEYIGSEDQPEELRIQHLLSWKEKQKQKKAVKGFGSDKTAWDSPHNIKYRQTIYQENKKNDDN